MNDDQDAAQEVIQDELPEASASLVARATDVLLSDDVLVVAGVCAFGLFASIMATNYLKPYLLYARFSAAKFALATRTLAFAVACAAVYGVLPSVGEADGAVTWWAAIVTGFSTPLAYDLWWRRIHPRLFGKKP